MDQAVVYVLKVVPDRCEFQSDLLPTRSRLRPFFFGHAGREQLVLQGQLHLLPLVSNGRLELC